KINKEFIGEWDWEKNTPGNSFFIRIVDNKKTMAGTYDRIQNNARKVDAPFEDEASFQFSFPETNFISTEFLHYASRTKGKIRLTVEGGKLIWEILEKPSFGDFPLPDHALLKRRK
ncbi:MAG: hypothetical protein JNM63_14795, partial [Spirochaetia bacterium]|nr:hypothetical protein [Spirochaetia bacterium]